MQTAGPSIVSLIRKVSLVYNYLIVKLSRGPHTITVKAATTSIPNQVVADGTACTLRAAFVLVELVLVCATCASRSGQFGATSTSPYWLATQRATPFVQPNPACTVYSPPLPAESMSEIENFSNICSAHKQQKQDREMQRLTLPVLLALWVTFNSWSERRGRTPGIEPPVACLTFCD